MKKVTQQISVIFIVALATVYGMLGFLNYANAAPALSSEDGTRDTITALTVVDAAITQTLGTASGDGHKFRNFGRQILIITNSYSETITPTIVTGGQVAGIDIADIEITITAGTTKIAGPFRTAIYNQPSGSDAGQIYLDWNTEVTGTVADSVTLGVFTVNPL